VRIAYVYFDLVHQPYCGWEYRVSEILEDLGHTVFRIPKHMVELQKKLPIPDKSDVIYVSNPMCTPIGLAIKERTNLPLVVNFLDIPIRGVSEEWRFNVYEKLKPFFLKADHIVVISKWTAGEVERWLDRKVDFVNYLGVDEDVFRAFVPENSGEISAVVRGMAAQKHHQDVIEAVKRSRTKPKLNLIYGQWSDQQKAKVISKSMFGIGMSTFEGFGVYCTEFGYYSKPFIAYELPVFREIYENAIEYVHSADEMAEKIDLFVQDGRLRGEKGKELHDVVMQKELTLHAHTERLEKILLKAGGEGQRHGQGMT